MESKLSYILKKSKPVIIISLILWIVLSIVLIMPVTVQVVDVSGGTLNIPKLITSAIDGEMSITDSISKVFTENYINVFFKGEIYLLISILILLAIGMVKAVPKNEYTDIEHGSSNWATGGEQYKILSPKKGILLAEKNYLPVDKRGNVNVMVVGRFWFW